MNDIERICLGLERKSVFCPYCGKKDVVDSEKLGDPYEIHEEKRCETCNAVYGLVYNLQDEECSKSKEYMEYMRIMNPHHYEDLKKRFG